MSTSRPMLLASRASVTVPDVPIAVTPEGEPLEEGSEVPVSIGDGEEQNEDGYEVSRANSGNSVTSPEGSIPHVDSTAGFDTDLEIDDEKEDFDLSGVKIYAETCRELGVVPVSYFMRHMKGANLAMRHHGLGPLGAKAIAVPLVSNTVVSTLDLEDNWIEAGGAIYIADMLKENCYITNLNLSNNNIGTVAAKAVCEMLLINSTLTTINLSGNGFQDKDGQLFAQVILENSNIQHLNLSHNSFGHTSGEVLGHAIGSRTILRSNSDVRQTNVALIRLIYPKIRHPQKGQGENEALETLDLSWNNFRRDSGVKIVDGIQVNSRLKRVNLSWNGLGPEGAIAISNCLKNNSILIELNISSTRIVPEGAAIIAKGLEVNETLQTLKAGQNLFGSKGAFMLLDSINNERSILTELDLTVKLRVFLEIYERQDNHACAVVGQFFPDTFLSQISPRRYKKSDLEQFLRTNTWAVIKAHLEGAGLSIADIFKQYDKEGRGRITCTHFKNVIQTQNIRLTEEQMATLQERLQALSDANGTVNYREIIEGATGLPQQ